MAARPPPAALSRPAATFRRLHAVGGHLQGSLGPHRGPSHPPAPRWFQPAPQHCLCPASTSVDSASMLEEGAVSPDVAIFDMECDAIRTFKREQFLIEGCWLWSGVMLPWVRASWTAALQRVQRLQDDMVLADWSQHNWEEPPLEVKQQMLGGSGSTGRPSFDLFKPPTPCPKGQKPRLPLGSGSWPEHFAAGADAFLMSMLTHPQMLTLHRMMIGAGHTFRSLRRIWICYRTENG
jgi:hypothetical protein